MGKKDRPMPSPMPGIRLAQAWVPHQPYECLFPLNEALIKGTIFPNLYQPYKKKNHGR
ncbi:spore coat associated protein CotJA [Dehalobacterium formicoaceticum]|uniref:spore coat associated protein CotJA n=1 Tax=Dehalobacterium formicoaceticum TaxID=51515 RepID=UPI000B7FEF05|nr:spore coat associated protein CotJA [Dehalobacterium formicoaceticum]